MAWTGGQHLFGDRIDNGQTYYPIGFNKTNIAIARGKVLFAVISGGDQGKLRVATTGDRGPFYVSYNATVGSDVKQHCWADEGNWLVLENTVELKPNDLVVPITGQVRPLGTGGDFTTGVLGIYRGLADDDADLRSNNVLQQDAPIGSKCAIEIRNFPRLPTS